MAKTENSEWDGPPTDVLRLLVQRVDLSYQEITQMINAECRTMFSRNAVIGKAKRLGLVKARDEVSNRLPRPPRKYVPRKYVPRPKKIVVVHRQALEEISEPRSRQIRLRQQALPEAMTHEEFNSRSLTTQGIAIDALTGDNCHWPLGGIEARPPYEFCGADKLDGGPLPYCEHHTHIALKPRRGPIEED